MKKGSGTQKLNCYTREIFKKPILLESLGLYGSYFLLQTLIQSVNSVKKTVLYWVSPDLVLFLNFVKLGIAPSEPVLSGAPRISKH